MPKIYFTSGKTLEITDDEFKRIAPKLQYGGIRLYRTSKGNLIPLNSTTIELIEKDEEEVFEVAVNEPQPESKVEEVTEEHATVEHDEKEDAPVEEAYPEKEEPKKAETQQERQDRMMAEMIKKSECLHEGLQKMFYQETKAGKRYFPVCSFCGKRERYVSVKKIKDGKITDWTMDDLVTAKEYREK